MSRIAAPRSVRGRLLVATLALVALGLAAASIATYAFLNSFLVHRVDDQLRSSLGGVAQALSRPGPGPVPFGVYALLLDADGTVVRAAPSLGYDGDPAPAPVLPPDLPGSDGSSQEGVRLFTTGSETGGLRYRAVAVPLSEGAGTVVAAISLTDVQGTLHRLVVVELIVVVTVLLLVGLAALGVVRIGLRPLTEMEDTAGAIAAGDLSRRVTPAEPDTEVGRLGLALNAMLAQIEQAFAERTASEQRLRRFVADASHELRTPLTSIGGYAQLFRHGAADRPQDLAKTMERIEAEAARMGVLVEDLLVLARLDEGMTVARAPFDLAALAGRAVEDARAADPDAPLDLRSDGPVEVDADEDRVRQVLDNLIANARAHTPAGTRATVAVARGDDGEAVLEIADEGPGIAPEDRERVFERFYRADESRSRSAGGGSGLGLAIAAEIARAHGGTLELVPTERGATFRLTLPPDRPDAPADPPGDP